MLWQRPARHTLARPGVGTRAGSWVSLPAMESPASPRRRRISARTKLAFSSGSLEQAMVGAAGVATMI